MEISKKNFFKITVHNKLNSSHPKDDASQKGDPLYKRGMIIHDYCNVTGTHRVCG
jgi:hypothetical protein